MKQRKAKDDAVYKAQLGATIMMTLGAMEVIGAVLTGRLIKKFNKRFGVHFLSAVGLICCLYMIILLSNDVTFGWQYYIAAALWGLADSAISTSLIALLATEFEDKAAALGVNGFIESIMKFIGYLVFSYCLL
jgi:MFS family permease